MVFERGICSSESSTVTYDGSEKKKNRRNNITANFAVLVVDDDDDIIRTINKLMLKIGGLEVQLAVNGKQAVDLHRVGASFNLILMDMEMPIMSGYQATEELRAMGVNCPIVGVTSTTEEAELKKFIESGLYDIVPKPLTVDKIIPYLARDHEDDKYEHAYDDDDHNSSSGSSNN